MWSRWRPCLLGAIAVAIAGCSSDDSRGESPTPQEVAEFWDEDEDATRRAAELLGQMSIDDKVNMLHGEANASYGFFNAPIDRLGIPALTMADGPIGVRIANPDANEKRATQLPSGLALAATWDTDLATRFGELAGIEAFDTGHNVLLGPVVDIVRVPQWGRAFESYGEDPLLGGLLGAANVRGVQSNPVVSSVKYYLGYTQETNRHAGGNAVINERTLQEIYVRPFAITVREGHPGATMCGLNKINGEFACENENTIAGILKSHIGFEGWVMSDRLANHSTVDSILAGLDQDMPGNLTPATGPGACLFCGPLLEAVANGEVPESRIDDAVTRILRPMLGLDLFEETPVITPFREGRNGAVAREIAERAIVLLRNGGALPLGQPTSIAVIGADADTVVSGGGSSRVNPTYTVSPLDGIRDRAGESVRIEHLPGADPVTSAALLPGPAPVPSDFLAPPEGEEQGLRAAYYLNPSFEGDPALDRVDPYAAINGGLFLFEGFGAASPHFPEQPPSLNTNISIRWTGRLHPPVTGTYELALTSTGTSQLFLDDQLVLSTAVADGELTTSTASVDLEAGAEREIRIEFVNDAPREHDFGPRFKFGWIPPAGVVAPQAQAAADLARDADVAIVLARDYSSEGGDKPDLALPNGQDELIRQVAAANPATIVVLTAAAAVRTSDWDGEVAALLHAWYGGQEQGNAIARVLFGDVNPSGKLPITMPVDEASTPISSVEQFPGTPDQQFSEGIFVGYRGYEERGLPIQYPFGHGLSYTTFDYSGLRISAAPGDLAFQVAVRVHNGGEVAGSETVQLYVGRLPVPVESAPRALAGWGRVSLDPGESGDVIIEVRPESVSYWDVETDRWQIAEGELQIHVGSSSTDIRLNGTTRLPLTQE